MGDWQIPVSAIVGAADDSELQEKITYVGAKVYMLRQTVEFHLKYLNLVHLSALLNGILVSTWVCVLGNHNATPLCDLLSERDITSVQPFPSGNASADESRICRVRKDPLGQGLISLIGIAGNEVPHLTVNLSTHYEATGDRFSNSSIVLVNAELLGQELIWNFWVPFNSDTDHLNQLVEFGEIALMDHCVVNERLKLEGERCNDWADNGVCAAILLPERLDRLLQAFLSFHFTLQRFHTDYGLGNMGDRILQTDLLLIHGYCRWRQEKEWLSLRQCLLVDPMVKGFSRHGFDTLLLVGGGHELGRFFPPPVEVFFHTRQHVREKRLDVWTTRRHLGWIYWLIGQRKSPGDAFS
ncbi:hypothetical protein HG530_000527 [Fusarium avenaceum]|nr:hypothetical protein HG530_000527 [Fusarium avenaceum]